MTEKNDSSQHDMQCRQLDLFVGKMQNNLIISGEYKSRIVSLTVNSCSD